MNEPARQKVLNVLVTRKVSGKDVDAAIAGVRTQDS